jgi:hypothetical protein
MLNTRERNTRALSDIKEAVLTVREVEKPQQVVLRGPAALALARYAAVQPPTSELRLSTAINTPETDVSFEKIEDLSEHSVAFVKRLSGNKITIVKRCVVLGKGPVHAAHKAPDGEVETR